MTPEKMESSIKNQKLIIARIKDIKLPYSSRVQPYEDDPIYHRLNITEAEDLEKINRALDNVLSYRPRYVHSTPPPIIAIGAFPYDSYMSKYNSTRYFYVRDDVKEDRKKRPSKSKPNRKVNKKCKCRRL